MLAPSDAGRRYLTDGGDRLVVSRALSDQLARGATLLALAIAVAAVSPIAAWIAREWFAAIWGVGAGIALVIGSLGAIAMIRAPSQVRASMVELDLAERIAVRADRTAIVLSGIRAVTIERGRVPFTSLRLMLVHDEGHRTELLRGVPFWRGRALTGAADHLADALGAELEVPPSIAQARDLSIDRPEIAAALCYAPIEGLYLPVALWFLMTARDPRVRFAAKQSLTEFACAAFVGLVTVSCCGLPAFAFSGAIAGVLVSMPLVLLEVVRLAVRVIAAMRAHRGELWVMPGLGPIVRRWLPLERAA